MLKRKEKVIRVIDRLLHRPSFLRALIADGWTEEMAHSGHAFHERTWREVESILEQVREIEGKVITNRVCHIWPALPGAGVSPVLFGALCGVKAQHIKASQRGPHFANHFVSCAQELGVSFSTDPLSRDYERLIVSGSDETIRHFKSLHANVVGFGHRESIAVVDSGFNNFEGLANDIAQWDQQGCFSVRAVFYIGDDTGAFSQNLADALYEKESASSHDSDVLAARIQKRGITEMTSEIFVSRLGRNENCAWVSSASGIWSGGTPAAGCVNVYSIGVDEPESLFSLIGLPFNQRQGVALSVGDPDLKDLLLDSGFTHVSDIGQMQSPPLAWLHDGRSNVEMFLR